MKKIAIILILLLLSISLLHAEESTFCSDAAAWDNFNSMIRQNSKDVPLQILHALKIGLCVKIKNNSLTESEAINLFKDMVDAVINKRDEEEKAQKGEES